MTFEGTATTLFFACVAAVACVMPVQNDTWWHLRAGEEMWRRQFVMITDEFSFTAYGAHWPNHQWLGEVILYPFFEAGGLPLLTLFAALCVTVTVWLSWRLMAGPAVVRLVLMALAISSIAPGWTVRPHIFSQLFFLVTVHLAMCRIWWPLPLLFVVWANVHGAVVLGLLVLGAATAANLYTSGWQRAWQPATTLLAGAAATLFTPLGIDLWLAIPESIDKSVANGIAEWRPPGFGASDFGFWVLAAAFAAVVGLRVRAALPGLKPGPASAASPGLEPGLASVASGLKPEPASVASGLKPEPATVLLVVLAVLLLPLAVRHVRNVTSFALIVVPLLSRVMPLPSLSPRVSRQRAGLNAAIATASAIGGALAVALAWSIPAQRLNWTPVSPAIVDSIKHCSGRLYNRFDDGGYVIWFARVPVFVDSRQDPFELPFLQEHLQTESSGTYRDVFDKYDLECAFLPTTSPTAKGLLADGWQVDRADGEWVVLRPVEQRTKNIEQRTERRTQN